MFLGEEQWENFMGILETPWIGPRLKRDRGGSREEDDMCFEVWVVMLVFSVLIRRDAGT